MLGLQRPAILFAETFTPQAQGLFSRMTTQPDGARKAAIDALIRALIVAGVWSKLDVLYVTAAHDAQAAQLNWKGASFTLNPFNAPAFVADRGYTGDGATSYLDTGYTPGVSAGVAGQDSNHFGVWCRTNVNSAGFDFAATNVTINSNNAGNINSRNMATTTDVVGGIATSIGHTLHSRSGAADYAMFKNAASLGTVTRASASPAAASLYLCTRNSNGTPAGFGTRQISAAHAGAALSGGEITALYTALNTFLTAIGAA